MNIFVLNEPAGAEDIDMDSKGILWVQARAQQWSLELYRDEEMKM